MLGPEDGHAVDQGRPGRRQPRASATPRCRPRSARARPAPCSSSRRSQTPPRSSPPPAPTPGIARVDACADLDRRRATRSCRRSRSRTRPTPPSATRSTGSAATLPTGSARRRRGRREPRPRDARSRDATPLVIGVVLALGFLLLLVALQAPIIALVGVLTNLLATGAAFGVARLDLPGGPPVGRSRLRVAGLPRRLGAGVLLRDDLRDLDGLHGVPARVCQGAPGAVRRRRARGDDRRRRPLRPRDPRRGRRDGRGVLHLRALRARCRRRRWASSSASPSPSTRSSSGSCSSPSPCDCSAAGPGGARDRSAGCCPPSPSDTDTQSDVAACVPRARQLFAASPQSGTASSPKPLDAAAETIRSCEGALSSSAAGRAARSWRTVCGALWAADEAEITVVDRDDAHLYQPGLLFVPFGLAEADQLVRPRQPPAAPRHRLHRGRDRPRRHGRERGAPGRWACASLRRPDRRDRRAARAGGDRGHDRDGLARDGLPLLHGRGRDRARRRARAVRRRHVSS